MRKLVALGLGALLFVPAVGRTQGRMEKDPTAKASGGVLVKGWMARPDRPTQKVEDLRFEDMGGGFHITGGPHAIYWNPANVAKGNYTVRASMAKTKATAHDESYGIFIGGTNLDNDKQNYLYCVVFGSGAFSVIHRYGSETHKLADKTANAAVAKAGENGTAKDEIAMTVSDDKVSCSINGTEVWTMPKGEVIGMGKLESTDGIYGLRASHNLSIHVAGFGMSQAK
jgi:hypothetical protein